MISPAIPRVAALVLTPEQAVALTERTERSPRAANESLPELQVFGGPATSAADRGVIAPPR